MRFLSLSIVVFYSLSVFGLTGAQRLIATQAPAGAPPYVNAHSLAFNGTTGYVTGTNHTAQDFTSAFTINIWVNGSSASASGDVIDKSYPDRKGYWMYSNFSTPGKISGWGFQDVSNYNAAATSVNVFDSTWHMVTWTWSSGTIKIYVDGTEDTSLSSIHSSGITSIGADAASLTMGADQFPTVGTFRSFYTGKLTNLSLWNITLNSTQVGQLATAGKPADLSLVSFFSNCKGWYKAGDGDATGSGNVKDSSGNGFDMTITGGVTVDTDHP